MKDYIYDNTFQGYLTAIFKLYEAKAFDAGLYREALYEGHLLNDPIYIHTDREYASRVTIGILQKLGEEWFTTLHKVYLSECVEGDKLGFEALRLGFKWGKNMLEDEGHEIIQPFLKLSRKVSRETHNFLGYLRFAKLSSGIYYSQFEPTYNLLPLLAPHFADRLKDQSWVIHDTRRKMAAFYNQKSWYINPLVASSTLDYAEDEISLQNSWRGYFEALAIKERSNLKLQQQKIPKKYWNFFTEDIGVFKQNTIK
jgi:probable DNA metabolism protein